MKQFHLIEVSVFSKEENDPGAIEKTLRSLFPFDLEQERLQLTKKTASGFKEKKIIIFEVRLEKQKHLTAFVEHLMANLHEDQKALLLRQKQSRLDEDLNFFFRLDKEKLLGGDYYITDSGNCFHIKMSVAAFPAKRDKALEVIEKLFK